MNFTDPQGMRIWRLRDTDSYNDEILHAAATHTDEALARVAAEGFTHVWLFGHVYLMMNSTVFPELNDPKLQQRLDSANTVIQRAKRHGLGVVIYFNDPIAVDSNHPVWVGREHLQGQPFSIGGGKHYSLCVSQPEVRDFFRQATASVIDALPGLAAVLLITACEHPTHCWSKSVTRPGGRPPTVCPRCKDREPAESVLTLLDAWSAASCGSAGDNANRVPGIESSSPRNLAKSECRTIEKPRAASDSGGEGCLDPGHPNIAAGPRVRVIAWNWEWAYWYADPQTPISTHLPKGIELLLDIEIGGTRPWRGKTQFIPEYSLGYVGPSERFEATRLAVAPQGTMIHAKIELNVTHEMASVPNLPLLSNVHAKLSALYQRGVAGYLGCWHQGSGFTLNTAAASLFNRDPKRYIDPDAFLGDLAAQYLGIVPADGLKRGWKKFAEAWANYPFSIGMLYKGVHNDAPARRMSLHYEGKPLGRSFIMDPPGDDLSTCLRGSASEAPSFTLDEVIDAVGDMKSAWNEGLIDYEPAFGADWNSLSALHRRHRHEELGCAKMIGIQLTSMLHAFEFHRERLRIMSENGLTAPCTVPMSVLLAQLMRDELANVERALPLVDADPRLGFHRESQGYKYDGASIRAKIGQLTTELDGSC